MKKHLWVASIIAIGAMALSAAATAKQLVVSAISDTGTRLSERLFNYMASTGLVLAMTTLAANKARAYELGDAQEYPVVATDIIYEGAAVGENAAGYARPLVAGDPFLGFASRKADNSAGLAGAIGVEVKRRGQIQLLVAGATAVTANDRPLVYASDDDTFTLTASTNSIIGRVSRWVSSGVCVVEFDAALAAAEAARVAGDV
jgi:hypothetical protein